MLYQNYIKIIHGIYIYIYTYVIYIHTTIEHNQKNGRGLMWAEETHRVHSVQIPTYQDKRNIYIYIYIYIISIQHNIYLLS